jgi:hypothetical protein
MKKRMPFDEKSEEKHTDGKSVPESFTFPSEDADETEINEKKETQSEQLQRMYLEAVGENIVQTFLEKNPTIPQKERIPKFLQNAEGKEIGVFEKIRETQKLTTTGREESWLIVDFDDVINFTSEYNADLFKKIEEATGLSKDECEELYESSKIEKENGKRIFQISEFRKQLFERFPKKQDDIEQIFDAHEKGNYVNESMKRMLVLLQRKSSLARISILSYGDIEYQKRRIEQSGITDLVDDIILTQGSKRETLESLMAQEYPAQEYINPRTKQKEPVPPPNIITVDDSPEHLDDYEQLPFKEHYANVRYQHPKGKRSDKPHKGQGIITATENAPNEAALQLYYMFHLAGSGFPREKLLWGDLKPNAREKINFFLEKIPDPEKRWDVLSYIKAQFPDEKISYHQEGNKVIREAMTHPTPWAYEQVFELDYVLQGSSRRPTTPWGKRIGERHVRKEVGTMQPDGSLTLNSDSFLESQVDAEEFILNGK